MNQGTLNLVEAIRYLSLLVRDFCTTLEKEKGTSPSMQEESSACSSPCFSRLSNDSSGKSLTPSFRRSEVEAMATSLSALRHDQTLAWNSLRQLEHDFLIYGKYNVEKLQDIVMTVNSLQNRTLSIERLSLARICKCYG